MSQPNLIRPPPRFVIGQVVRVRRTFEYASDYIGDFVIVAGRWEYPKNTGDVNYELATKDEISRGSAGADGFYDEDLEAV